MKHVYDGKESDGTVGGGSARRVGGFVAGGWACVGVPASVADGYRQLGDVQISADRKDVTLCDRLDDEDKVAVEYKTTIGRTILLQAGPKQGCVSDSVVFGSIKWAKFCYGPDVDPDGGSWRWCNQTRNL